jgi:hypothetical protein
MVGGAAYTSELTPLSPGHKCYKYIVLGRLPLDNNGTATVVVTRIPFIVGPPCGTQMIIMDDALVLYQTIIVIMFAQTVGIVGKLTLFIFQVLEIDFL